MTVGTADRSTEERKPKRRLIPEDPPKKPDADAMRAEIGKLRDEVKKHRDGIDQLKEAGEKLRNTENGPREQLFKEKVALQEEKAKIMEGISALRKDKREFMDSYKKTEQDIRETEKELRAERNADFKTPEEIEKRVAELEFKLETGGVGSIKGERRIMNEIKQLNSVKEKAARLVAAGNTVLDARSNRDEMKQKRDKMQASIEEQQLRIQMINDKLDQKSIAIDATSNNQERRAIREKQDALYAKVHECNAKMDKVREDFNTSWDTYKQLNEEYREKLDAARKAQAKERAEQQAKYEEEEKKKQLELKALKRLNPYGQEITDCNNLIAYLTKKTQAVSRVPDRKAESKAVEFDAAAAAKGKFQVLKKDDDEDWLRGSGKKTKAKKPAAPKATSAAPAAAPKFAAKPKAISHQHEKVGEFSKYGIPLPTTTDMVRECIEKLKAKVVHYESFKKTEKEAMEEEAAEEAAKAAKAAAEAAAAAVAASEAKEEEE